MRRKRCHLPFHKLPKRCKPQMMTMPEPKLSYDLAAPTGEARFQVAEDERELPVGHVAEPTEMRIGFIGSGVSCA